MQRNIYLQKINQTMKTLILLLFPAFLSAQLTTTPKVIYKAAKTETVVFAVSPTSETVISVKTNNDVYDDNALLTGYHVLNIALDSGDVIIASSDKPLGYTTYVDGRNVKQPILADNTNAEINTYLNGLSIANYRKVVNRLIIKFLNKKEITQ